MDAREMIPEFAKQCKLVNDLRMGLSAVINDSNYDRLSTETREAVRVAVDANNAHDLEMIPGRKKPV